MIFINVLFWTLIIFFSIFLVAAVIAQEFDIVEVAFVILLGLFFTKGCANYVIVEHEWHENDKCQQVEKFYQSLRGNLINVQMSREDNNIQGGQCVTFKISFNNKNHKVSFTEDRYGDPVYLEWHLDDKLLFQNGKINGNEFKYFCESNYTNEDINEEIYDELNEIYLEWQKAVTPKEGAFLLNQTDNSTKTLEVTAPVDSTITGTVMKQGQTIHTETL